MFPIKTMNYGWQYDSKMWAKVPSEIAKSRSWRAVSFSETEATAVPSEKPGIYLLCTSPVGRILHERPMKNDLFSRLLSPIYIGKTRNLRRRFLEHCRRPNNEISAARNCFQGSMLFWFHLRDRHCIDQDEAILIQCFGPTANKKQEALRGIAKETKSIGIQKATH